MKQRTSEPNGKIILRMPRGLHRRLVMMAQREGVSLNALLSAFIAEHIGMMEKAEHISQQESVWPTASTASGIELRLEELR